jgi:hypothetical protein
VVNPLLHYSNTVCARFTVVCTSDKLKMVKLCLAWLCYLLTCMLTAYDKCVAVCISFSVL